MELDDVIVRLKSDLRVGRFTNEAAVSQGAVLPVLNALEWPVFDTSVVAPEFTVEGRRVDFALCHPEERPVVFLEVKRVGATEGADRQLFEYAFHKGIPLAVLTDGQEWHFYLPAEQGDYQDRRVYKLDLLERDLAECTSRLQRYLSRSAIASGEAFKAARLDYLDVTRQRQVRQTLPRAWTKLLEEPDELLLELLADKVEDLCGFKPDPNTCGKFIEGIHATLSPSLTSPISRVPETLRPRSRVSAPLKAPRTVDSVDPKTFQSRPRVSASSADIGFVLHGRQHRSSSAREVLTSLFQMLASEDPTFLERFAARKHGRKRRYVARNRYELYPDRRDLSENFSFELSPGWFIGTNYAKRDIEKIIQLACEVTGLRYGEDVVVNLGE